ncbi:MAG: hemolysin [Flavobacteriaceae bacterium]|nr:hemolysin [Flavobacteriaceae bacterium]|tara:strand:+ start:10000 stop:11274 length:1275 start_codon:yes stop_codon:yes gene_type:complete
MLDSDIVIICALLLSAFFSGLEIAFVSSNRLFLEIQKKRVGFSSRLLKNCTKNPSKFIATMLVGNNISLVIYGIFMGDRILGFLFPESMSNSNFEFDILLYQTTISTIIILVTAEFLPKVFFQLYSHRLITLFAIPAAFFFYLFNPITTAIIKLNDWILNYIFKIQTNQVQLSFSKIELGDYIEDQIESFKNKEGIDSEIQIFQNALDFSALRSREVMVPRTEIIAVEQNTTSDELREIFIETGLSKIPVYRESIDNIVGYIHAFEMFRQPKKIKDIILPVSFIPEPMPINKVLELLSKQRRSMAIVLDEYGGTSGLITIEDIVEELFGEIEDEHDHIDHTEKQLSQNKFEFSARLEVDYVNQNYELEIIESDLYETLGGWIVHHTEKIPKKNDIITIQNFRLKVLEVSSNKIERVLLEKLIDN